MVIFIWDEKNVDHIAAHDVTPAEAVYVVRHIDPIEMPEGRFVVWGPTDAGRLLQVIFVYREDEASTETPKPLRGVEDGRSKGAT